MDAEARREKILEILRASRDPVSAAAMARRFGVSRQIVVGDVALLRAKGELITSTFRGYIIPGASGEVTCRISCRHSIEQLRQEMNIIIDNGCSITCVEISHPVYGTLRAELSLASRYDVQRCVDTFAESGTMPLSALRPDGIHTYTLLCPDEQAAQRVRAGLREAGILAEE